ncbi:Kunitz-type protease inhibitor 4 [Toxocara canis]|uniref:Kunitz-type protease inhibitor 4 n=1 Tax=Toxocara canis TaxID=6265 RepID=A0A0B2UYA3_TOXCA|nr:Kunitz-type protease inhibitor 4 [Toxocara canis]
MSVAKILSGTCCVLYVLLIGYDGDEERYGYKSLKSSLNIRSLATEKRRARRAASLAVAPSPQSANHPVRIDSKAPRQYSRSTLKRPSKIDPCSELVDTGSCNEAHLRYFYDRRADTCRLFYYSGCNGNSNNFATQYECEQRCKMGRLSKLATPPGTCPDGRLPLGENAPVLCGNQTDSIGCPAGYYCRTGPPDVCCPKDVVGTPMLSGRFYLESVLKTSKKSKGRRSKPQIDAAGTYQGEANVAYGAGEAQQAIDTSKTAHETGSEAGTSSEESAAPSPLSTPPNMCPDGSDALLDEQTGAPVKCGAGFDGQALCPVGFYCSIDWERNGRLCCPMGVYGSKIPPPPVIAPYLGFRRPNPGEVIERGSLPSDPKPPRLPAHKSLAKIAPAPAYDGFWIVAGESEDSSHIADSAESGAERGPHPTESGEDSNIPEPTSGESQQNSAEFVQRSGNVVAPILEDTAKGEEPYGRMMMKPANKQQLQLSKAFYGEIVKSATDERDSVQIDIGDAEDPFESEQPNAKKSIDRSVCQMKPTEGRPCRENETAPRTNLQYFYSRRDSKCKLYFYRGCGGNANRFEKKRDCESLCMGFKKAETLWDVALLLACSVMPVSAVGQQGYSGYMHYPVMYDRYDAHIWFVYAFGPYGFCRYYRQYAYSSAVNQPRDVNGNGLFWGKQATKHGSHDVPHRTE